MYLIYTTIRSMLDNGKQRELAKEEFAEAQRKLNQKMGENGAALAKKTPDIKRVGVITKLTSDRGCIDDYIYFEFKQAKFVFAKLTINCKVEYLVSGDSDGECNHLLEITGIVEKEWTQNEQSKAINVNEQSEVLSPKAYTKENKVVLSREQSGLSLNGPDIRFMLGLIMKRDRNSIVIETELKSVLVQLDDIEINFAPMEGDRVTLCCKGQLDEGWAQGDMLDQQLDIGVVLKVSPSHQSNETCTVQHIYDGFAELDNNCYLPFDMLPAAAELSVGDVIVAEMIECERFNYTWRCVSFTKSVELPMTSDADAGESEATTRLRPLYISNAICFFSGTGQTKTGQLTIRNQSDKPITITGIIPKRSNVLQPVDVNCPFELAAGEERCVEFTLQSVLYGETRETFVVQLARFHVTRYIRAIVCDGEEAALAAQEKRVVKNDVQLPNRREDRYRTQYKAQQVWSKKKEVIPGVYDLKRPRFIAVRIEQYLVPEQLRSAYLESRNRIEAKSQIYTMFPSLCGDLCPANYTSRFRVLLYLEEIETFIQFRKYDLDRAHFKHEGEYLSLQSEYLCDMRPLLCCGDTVRATDPWAPERENPICYDGIIHKRYPDRILLKFNAGFHSKYKGDDYSLEFHFSRYVLRKKHHAITDLTARLPDSFLFPTTIKLRTHPRLNVELDAECGLRINGCAATWQNSQLNAIQKAAIVNILRSETESMPYVIFGPPGTGKTATLVELILQIYRHMPGSCLLVAAPSNSAADMLSLRLIEVCGLQPVDFVRLVSQNIVERDVIPPKLLPFCITPTLGIVGTFKESIVTTEKGLRIGCSKQFFNRYRILIGTCATLGNMIPMGYQPGHFTHAIVDECGQCTEPEAMLCISQVTGPRTQVVLAGDPHQLAPLVMDPIAATHGMAVSFIERLLLRPPYQKDMLRHPNTSGYDPRLITKLLHSYRALPSILAVYNELFYDGELVPTIDPVTSREALSLKMLNIMQMKSEHRDKAHGVFFYGAHSEAKQDPESPSWYNPLEAKNVFLMVLDLYDQKIKSESIGVITPYAMQAKLLRNLFTVAGMEIPKIGTVEDFQGQERDIIIVTTVRSASVFSAEKPKSLDFVLSAKRMNVSVSRARFLLCVFGNPQVLSKAEWWFAYIKHCMKNDAYIGCDVPEFRKNANPEVKD